MTKGPCSCQHAAQGPKDRVLGMLLVLLRRGSAGNLLPLAIGAGAQQLCRPSARLVCLQLSPGTQHILAAQQALDSCVCVCLGTSTAVVPLAVGPCVTSWVVVSWSQHAGTSVPTNQLEAASPAVTAGEYPQDPSFTC